MEFLIRTCSSHKVMNLYQIQKVNERYNISLIEFIFNNNICSGIKAKKAKNSAICHLMPRFKI